MASDTSTNPFAKLNTAKLDTFLTRSTKQPTQETRKPGNQESIKPVSQEPVKPETQETRKRAAYPKKTYNLHPDVVDMIEEIKRKLERHYSVKVSREEIVEEAIRQAFEDFQKNQETSLLVIQFTRKPENQETRK